MAGHSLTDEQIRSNFDNYDKDSSGKITTTELKEIYAKLGLNLSDESILNWINKYDTDHDGQISYPEFYKMISGKEYAGK